MILDQKSYRLCVSWSGDEGQALGESYMSFHFQPDLCPWLSNAGVILDRMDEILVKTVQVSLLSSYWLRFNLRSRLLITTIPSSMYVWDENGVNVTLQSAAEIITNSMNELSTNGALVRDVETNEVSELWTIYFCIAGSRICRIYFLQPVANTYPENAHTEVITFRFFVVQFKGDWKYLVQLFNLTNQPTKEKAGLQSPWTAGPHDFEGSVKVVWVFFKKKNSWRSAGCVGRRKDPMGTWTTVMSMLVQPLDGAAPLVWIHIGNTHHPIPSWSVFVHWWSPWIFYMFGI